ncbi:NmrA family NAD(P)-binding protein [Microbacterium gorillae]|uniref:NmrA family NAD(P)-binding protein n=1 Tax=Microbacterium gorillae TaxID=1231063 RepID=UPI000694E140|nr:NmrA family NAD(P)-binding protein [Microbacterium gorillae]
MTTSTHEPAELPTLAVTGSTGNVGGAVARLLADAGVPQRLLTRDPARAPQLPGAVPVLSRYADDAETRASLAGVRTLFLVSGTESLERLEQHRAIIDAAAAAGVAHVVYTSFYGAAPDATFTFARDHWHTEQYLLRSGMATTFLRDDFYLDVLPHFVGEDGALRGPAGDGRVAAVARADVARVAATVLQDPAAHAGRTYDLTGPQALTLTEVAAIITEVTGREVRFVNETTEEAYASRAGYGAPDWQVDAWVSTYTAIRSGELQPATDDVRAVTGRPPISLAELLRADV